jgi:hypothetical protein
MQPDRDVAADADYFRGQILEHTHRSLAALAEQVIELDQGMALRTASLPLVWTLNQVRICGPTTAEDVATIADRHQGDLSYRHVVVEGDRAGALLVDELCAAGWWFEREVLMAMACHADRQIDTSRVIELGEGQMLALMRGWLLEERMEITDDGLAQVLEYNRRSRSRSSARTATSPGSRTSTRRQRPAGRDTRGLSSRKSFGARGGHIPASPTSSLTTTTGRRSSMPVPASSLSASTSPSIDPAPEPGR